MSRGKRMSFIGGVLTLYGSFIFIYLVGLFIPPFEGVDTGAMFIITILAATLVLCEVLQLYMDGRRNYNGQTDV